eukprot:s1111_g10.t1
MQDHEVRRDMRMVVHGGEDVGSAGFLLLTLCLGTESLKPTRLKPMKIKWRDYCFRVKIYQAVNLPAKALLQHVTFGRSKRSRRPPTNRTEAGLRDVVEYLRRAKGECLQSSVECLPALKQVRYRAWFFLQDLVHPKKKSWPLLDLHPQVFRGRCTGLGNNSILFLDLSTSASAASRASLEAMSDFQVVKAFEDDVHWCETHGWCFRGLSSTQSWQWKVPPFL